MLERNKPLAIYMEGAVLGYGGKMGIGVLRYSPNPIVAVIDSETAGQDAGEALGVPRKCPIVKTVDEARALGAEVLILGIAPQGGLIPAEWYPVLDHSVELGFSLVNGLHDLLGPRYPNLPAGQTVWDIRIEPKDIGPGKGLAMGVDAKRVLLYGTDMAVGKMTAGLEIHRVAKERGIKSEFVATGQIGITITGAGVPLDAIRVDFASGSIEGEVLRCGKAGAELIIVEGQGALIHPGSTANLPLMRGSCPSHMILCHRAGQTTLKMLDHITIPPLKDYVKLYEDLATACGTFPRPKTVAVALNTANLTAEEAETATKSIEDELGIPCADPIRNGPDKLVDALVNA